MPTLPRTILAAGLAVALGTAFLFTTAQGASEAPLSPPPDGEEFEQAALDFVAWCGPCHGATGKGGGPIASSLKTNPPNLVLLSKRSGGEFPTESVRERIDGRELPAAHGTTDMPVWGYWFNLQATAAGLLQEDRVVAEKEVKQRIDRLVIYLETLQE